MNLFDLLRSSDCYFFKIHISSQHMDVKSSVHFFGRIMVDYLTESIWEDHWRLCITRESACTNRHQTDLECLSDGFDMFPTLLVTDGSCMTDCRMGILSRFK